MNTKINDKPVLDLAHAVARFHKYKSHPIKDVAVDLLSKWEAFQDKEYLEDQDLDVPEKKIHILLQMLVVSQSYERQHILYLIASSLDDYASIGSSCPSGVFSKNLCADVLEILDPVL